MKQPVVFNAGSYLAPFGIALLISGLILVPQFGWWVAAIYAIAFYFMLVFLNSVDRNITEFRKKR